MIINEIKELRAELMSLIELQKNVCSGGDLENMQNNNSQINNSKIIDKSGLINEKAGQVQQCEIENKEEKSLINTNLNNNPISSFNIPANGTYYLPNIEHFFVMNNKFLLVDSDKNLWHLNQCNKYEEFTKQNINNFNSKEENLYSFLAYYQNLKKVKENNENSNCDVVEVNVNVVDKEEENNLAVPKVESCSVETLAKPDKNKHLRENTDMDDNYDNKQESIIDNNNKDNSLILSDSN